MYSISLFAKFVTVLYDYHKFKVFVFTVKTNWTITKKKKKKNNLSPDHLEFWYDPYIYHSQFHGEFSASFWQWNFFYLDDSKAPRLFAVINNHLCKRLWKDAGVSSRGKSVIPGPSAWPSDREFYGLLWSKTISASVSRSSDFKQDRHRQHHAFGKYETLIHNPRSYHVAN